MQPYLTSIRPFKNEKETAMWANLSFTKKVLQLNCKTQLMERDALNQQRVTQCYAIALIKSHRSLLVVGKTTGQYVKSRL